MTPEKPVDCLENCYPMHPQGSGVGYILALCVLHSATSRSLAQLYVQSAQRSTNNARPIMMSSDPQTDFYDREIRAIIPDFPKDLLPRDHTQFEALLREYLPGAYGAMLSETVQSPRGSDSP